MNQDIFMGAFVFSVIVFCFGVIVGFAVALTCLIKEKVFRTPAPMPFPPTIQQPDTRRQEI